MEPLGNGAMETSILFSWYQLLSEHVLRQNVIALKLVFRSFGGWQIICKSETL